MKLIIICFTKSVITVNLLIAVVKKGFEYEDDWNFRRLMEVATETIPGCKEEILRINADSSDPNIIEVMEDYS